MCLSRRPKLGSEDEIEEDGRDEEEDWSQGQEVDNCAELQSGIKKVTRFRSEREIFGNFRSDL